MVWERKQDQVEYARQDILAREVPDRAQFLWKKSVMLKRVDSLQL